MTTTIPSVANDMLGSDIDDETLDMPYVTSSKAQERLPVTADPFFLGGTEFPIIPEDETEDQTEDRFDEDPVVIKKVEKNGANKRVTLKSSSSSSSSIYSGKETNRKKKKKAKEERTSQHNDFFAESPYYDAFVEKEMYTMCIVSETMDEISAKYELFTKAGQEMANATRSLSMSCLLHKTDNSIVGSTSEEANYYAKKKNALGPKVTKLFGRIGLVLEEMAAAQELMCKTIEAALITNVAEHVDQDLEDALKMKEEINNQQDVAEQILFQYLTDVPTCPKSVAPPEVVKINRSKASRRNSFLQDSFTTESESDPSTSNAGEIIHSKMFSAIRGDVYSLDEEEDENYVFGSLDVDGPTIDDEREKVSSGQQQNTGKPWMKLTSIFSSKGSIGSTNDDSSNNSFSYNEDTSSHSYGADSSSTPLKWKRAKSAQLEISSSLEKRDALKRSATSVSTISTSDPHKDKAIDMASAKYTCERIRVNQTTAELKRLQLTKHFSYAKYRRNLEMSENTLKALHGMNTYFEYCSNKVSTLLPIINDCTEKHAARQLDNRQRWHEREKNTITALAQTKEEASKTYKELEEVISSDPAMIDKEMLKQDIIEMDVNVWDLPAELAMSSQYKRTTAPGVKMEGWIYQKNSTLMPFSFQQSSSWNKEWFVLKDGAIYCLRFASNGKQSKKSFSVRVNNTTKVKICDVVLTTVRELPDELYGRFCFELLIPHQRPIVLKTRGPNDLRMWVDGIRNAVAKQLSSGNPHAKDLNQGIGEKFSRASSEIHFTVLETHSDDSGDEDNVDIDSSRGNRKTRKRHSKSRRNKDNPLVDQIMTMNCFCADCGSEDPDWASLTFGNLVCIDCSGVHRSLGTHVSKVRSLTLDSITDREASLLLALGNERVNKIWERNVDQCIDQIKKPDSSSSRKTREDWIKKKYVDKTFIGIDEDYEVVDGNAVEDDPSGKNEKASRKLYEAAVKGDIIGVAAAIAHGADVNWQNEEGQTPLYGCLTGFRFVGLEGHSLECMQLLLQHQADSSTLPTSKFRMLEMLLRHNVRKDNSQI